MKRLTFEGNFCDIAQCFQLPTCDKDDYCSQRKVWERLKEYEDTGLEPEEIKALRELAKADEEGRLVVLPFGLGEDVGKAIREARKAAGLTQKELSDRIGLSQQSVAQWENGYRRPKFSAICKIADALRGGVLNDA